MGRLQAVIGIDLGGTKIASGIVSPAGEVLESRTAPTPATEGAEAIIRVVTAEIESLLHSSLDVDVQAIGIGASGMVDTQRGVIVHGDENLPGWAGTPVVEQIHARIGLPVYIDNDVNALAIGENRVGAGRGFREILYIAVGTGIGGALVRAGEIWRGVHYGAGEVGYLVAMSDENGQPLTIEESASGPALAKRYQKLSGSAELIGLRQVAARAQAGDRLAIRVIEEGARLLAVVLAPLVGVLDPEILIIGGGVPEIGDLWWQSFESTLRASDLPSPSQVQLTRAQLSTHAGLIGAAALALTAPA